MSAGCHEQVLFRWYKTKNTFCPFFEMANISYENVFASCVISQSAAWSIHFNFVASTYVAYVMKIDKTHALNTSLSVLTFVAIRTPEYVMTACVLLWQVSVFTRKATYALATSLKYMACDWLSGFFWHNWQQTFLPLAEVILFKKNEKHQLWVRPIEWLKLSLPENN